MMAEALETFTLRGSLRSHLRVMEWVIIIISNNANENGGKRHGGDTGQSTV
jgi:hypothetical protein